MKIRQKLLLGFLSNSILLGFIGAVSISTNIHNEYHVIQLSESSIKELEVATEMNHALEATQIAAQKLLIKKSNIETTKNIEKSKEAQIKLRAKLNEFTNYLADSNQITSFAISLAQERSFLAEIEQEKNELKMLHKLNTEFSIYKKLMDQYLFIINIDVDVEKAEQFLEETLEPHFQKRILPLIQEYELDARAELNSQATEILRGVSGAIKIISGASIFAIAIATFSGLFISYSIIKQINKLKKAVIRIGEGKLSTKVNIKSKDEIEVLANAFNQMSDRLNKTTVSKSYVDNIIKSMLDILIVTDSDAIITRVNQATINILGYEKSELLGKSIKIIFIEQNILNVLNIKVVLNK